VLHDLSAHFIDQINELQTHQLLQQLLLVLLLHA
jgi:hypothetical protein